MFTIKVALLLCFLQSCLSACPNSCSGHGSCGIGSVCACYDGWNGGAADCSRRECPKGVAWADKAYAIDMAHQSVTCSNAGICDFSTGSCKCFTGFSGIACQRSKTETIDQTRVCIS